LIYVKNNGTMFIEVGMIERPNYLEMLISFKEKDLIKIVTGIRRCGKSTLFDQTVLFLTL